jgi:hypothetical protein
MAITQRQRRTGPSGSRMRPDAMQAVDWSRNNVRCSFTDQVTQTME